MIIHEQCHGRSRPNRFVTDLFLVESEAFHAAIGVADLSDVLQPIVLSDVLGSFSSLVECTQGSVVIMILDELDHSLHCSSSAPNRTQSRILGLHLSTGIALQSILLVFEEDPDKKGQLQRLWMVGWDHLTIFSVETNSS